MTLKVLKYFSFPVWLEIKRRSQLQTHQKEADDNVSLTDSVFENCSMRNGLRRENEYVSHKCSYVEGKVGRRQATEHDDVVNETEAESPYETISVIERGNSLMIKFEKWNQHGIIKPESLKDSPILSHEKVINFLRDEGENFEMNICDWEYEKEQSVYSYISSNLKQGITLYSYIWPISINILYYFFSQKCVLCFWNLKR